MFRGWFYGCANRAVSMPHNGSSTERLRLSSSSGFCKERCPPKVAASSGRVRLRVAIDRRQYIARVALPTMGIVCSRRPDAVRRPSCGVRCVARLVLRSRGLVAPRPALPRCRMRLVARDAVMNAEVYRDEGGFWFARIEEDTGAPEGAGFSAVYRRQALPVPPSATQSAAEAALRCALERESRWPHGRR